MYLHEMLLFVLFIPTLRGPTNQHLLFVVTVLYWDLEKHCPGKQLTILRSALSQQLGALMLAHRDGAPGQWLHMQMERALNKTRVKGFSFVKCQRQKRLTDMILWEN